LRCGIRKGEATAGSRYQAERTSYHPREIGAALQGVAMEERVPRLCYKKCDTQVESLGIPRGSADDVTELIETFVILEGELACEQSAGIIVEQELALVALSEPRANRIREHGDPHAK